MAGEADRDRDRTVDRRRGVRRTVALLALAAVLIYAGFLARGFFGEAEPPVEESSADPAAQEPSAAERGP